MALAQWQQARAQQRARQALGTQDAEVELARRERELAEAEGTLTILEAGTRPEELEAARASVARLAAELRYLESIGNKLNVTTPVAGLMTTPHLRDKIGQFFREGDLICQVEEPSVLQAEILVADQEASQIQPGQALTLKPRGLPFHSFPAALERVSPCAVHVDQSANVRAYARIPNPPVELRPGTIGYARIDTGRRPIREILLERVLRVLRTEFW